MTTSQSYSGSSTSTVRLEKIYWLTPIVTTDDPTETMALDLVTLFAMCTRKTCSYCCCCLGSNESDIIFVVNHKLVESKLFLPSFLTPITAVVVEHILQRMIGLQTNVWDDVGIPVRAAKCRFCAIQRAYGSLDAVAIKVYRVLKMVLEI